MKRKSLLLLLASICLAPFASAQVSSNPVQITGVPLPTLQINDPSPLNGYVGSAGTYTITASTGSTFVSACTATFQGVAVTATFVDSTHLKLAIPSGKIVVGNTANPIIVTCPTPILSQNSPVQLPNATVGTTYSASLSTILAPKGGLPPYHYSVVSGSLPTGLTLSDSGNVTGTPSGAAGNVNFNIQVKDSSTKTVMLLNGSFDLASDEIAELPLPTVKFAARLT